MTMSSAGSWKRWLVQVRAAGRVGTGYPLGPNRILTAHHVVADGDVEVRFVREDEARWYPSKVVWTGADESDQAPPIDVALLAVSEDLEIAPQVTPAFTFPVDQRWESEGFPRASWERTEADLPPPPEPLQGSAHSLAPGARIWQLDVAAHPEADLDWQGFSGAPVMLRGMVAGVLIQLPFKWTGRVEAVPLSAFWSEPSFQQALGQRSVLALRDRSLETLRERLTKRLEPAWLRRRLVEDLGLDADPESGEAVATALLGASALQLADVLYNLAVEAEDGERQDDRPAVEDLARCALPLAREPLEAFEQALRQRGQSELLLAIETPIVAELLNAVLDGRAASFELRGDELVGRTLVPTPDVPVVRQEGFETALRTQLARQLRVATEGLGAQEVERRINARLRVLGSDTNPRRLGYYFLFRGQALESSDRKAMEKFPSIRRLGLTGGPDEELDLAEWLRLLFAGSEGGTHP